MSRLALLTLVVALPLAADGWEARIVWATRLTDTGKLLSIDAHGQMAIEHGRSKQHYLFAELLSARRKGAKWIAPRNGLYLTDHSFVVGGVVEIAADGSATIEHPLLGAPKRALSAEAIAGYGRSHGFVYKKGPSARIGRAAAQPLKGGLTLDATGLTATGADGKPLKATHEQLYLLSLRPQIAVDPRGVTLHLGGGTTLRGGLLRFDGARFELDTRWFGTVIIRAEQVDRIERGTPRADEGLLLVCDYEGKTIHRIDLVSGKTWKKSGYNYPNVFFRLERGKWLVSDSRDNEFHVIDDQGKLLRKIGVGLSNPWSAMLDKHGHLIIACCNSNKIVQMTRKGKILHTWTLPKAALRAVPLPNGNLVIAQTYANRVAEIDRKGKTIWEWKVKRPVDVDVLPGGNLLVCLETQKKVVEITRKKKIVWSFEKTLKNPYDADRLPNGNTLIVDRASGRVLAVDPGGEILWERKGFKGPVEVVRY